MEKATEKTEKHDDKDVSRVMMSEAKYSSRGMPVCRLCGQAQEDLREHLVEKHHVTPIEYEKDYPGWPLDPQIGSTSGKGAELSYKARELKEFSVKELFGFWWNAEEKLDRKVWGYAEPGPLTPKIDSGFVFDPDYTRVALLAFFLKDKVLTYGPTGCHAKGTQILMFDGKVKNVEDIEIGDQLMGPDSSPRAVLELRRGRQEMFEVTPVKGSPFIVNKDHVLSLVRTASVGEGGRSRGGKEGQWDRKREGLAAGGQVIDVTVREWIGWSDTQKHLHKLFRVGVDFPEAEVVLPLDPYFLGLLLGDGCFRDNSPGFTNVDPEIREEICCLSEVMGLQAKENDEISYRLVAPDGKSTKFNPLTEALRDLGLWGKLSKDKFIPYIYKVASAEDRREILAGLTDTDGSFDGSYDYISASEMLANDIAFVARSLGLAAYVSPCEKGFKDFHGHYFRVSISGHLNQIPCRLGRKQANPRQQKKDVRRTGFKVESTGREDNYYGFILDGDHRYLMGDFTVTHNSGKTSLWEQISARLNYNAVRINFDGGITRPDLVGQWIVKGREMEYSYGILPSAMTLPGTVIILDEWDTISEECSFVIQRVLEQNSQLLLMEKGEEVITLHPDNVLVATANTAGMGDDSGLYSQGTRLQNFSQINRFSLTIIMDYLDAKKEVEILTKRFPRLEKVEAEFIIKVVNLIRDSHNKGEIAAPLSTRDAINWAEKYVIWGDVEKAAKYTFINRYPVEDRDVLRGLISRAFA